MICTLDAVFQSKAWVMLELFRALFRNVTGAVVGQPCLACGEAKCMVKHMAGEEDLADVVVACEDTLCTLCEESSVEPFSSIGTGRVDDVSVCNAQDMPDCRNLEIVALLVQTSVYHLMSSQSLQARGSSSRSSEVPCTT